MKYLYLYLYLYLSLCLSLSGCAAGPQEVKRRYFWPPPPDEPRVEFIASYWSADDFPRTAKQKFLESVTGLEPARGFEKPWGIASNGEGKVYIVDTNLQAVVVFDLKNYTVDLLGKGGLSSLFWAPVGVTLDANGNVYVSDPRRNRVYSFTKDEKPLMTIGDDATLSWPTGMAVDNKLKRLYVVNGKSHNISVFDLDGKYLFSIGKRGDGDGEFNFPTDVDVDSKGNLVVADSMNARVQILDPEGRFIRKFGQRGDRAEDFQIIKGIAVSKDDNIYVVDGRADRILVFNKEGEPLTSIGGTAMIAETMKLNPGGFLIPQDIDIDKNDTIYVVDSMNKRFQVFQIINEEWLKRHPIER
ncbi:MAG: 6-bladed beta-propeller [Deltaproteobacteria bacterium]|nr:6-bladed beta-propeller [Deltaproteobacteria bacterium]